MSKIRTVFRIIRFFKNWPTFIGDYLGFIKNRNIFYQLRNGVKYLLRSGTCDGYIINEIWFRNVYTPEGFELEDNDTVLDVGAQIGVFSIFASRLVKNGRIFSFEPLPENFQLLNENKEYNQAKNIMAINKAVSNKTGERGLFLDSSNTGGHSLFKGLSAGKKITVATVSLDDFAREYNIETIDFLKMDCEGAEYEILFGCSKKTLSIIKKISMEYHNLDHTNNVQELKIFLEKNGFQVNIKSNNYRMLYAKR